MTDSGNVRYLPGSEVMATVIEGACDQLEAGRTLWEAKGRAELEAYYLADESIQLPTIAGYRRHCAHMEWLGDVIEAYKNQAKELLRAKTVGGTWAADLSQIASDLMDMSTDDGWVLAEHAHSTASDVAAELFSIAQETVDVSVRVRLRKLAHRLDPDADRLK